MINKNIVRVRDVMKKEFDVIDGMTTVSEALKKMKHVETDSKFCPIPIMQPCDLI